MMNKLDDYMRFHQLALSVRGQRQQLLASNIANADTPNYKARDIDFGSAMHAALGKTNGAQDLTKTAQAHLSQPGTVAGLPPAYRKEVQGSVDGNTVDMDVERNEFTENALRYEASLTIINMQIKGLLSAIQG
jgi:flagellar basal-body rod protein FlgB|nr:flagellar basal body rod protein FlgB [uncultured Undibacterium sp.]